MLTWPFDSLSLAQGCALELSLAQGCALDERRQASNMSTVHSSPS